MLRRNLRQWIADVLLGPAGRRVRRMTRKSQGSMIPAIEALEGRIVLSNLPVVSTLAASPVSATGATLNGTINPLGKATVAFQYSLDPSFTPTVASTLGSGFFGPSGLAVDTAGDLFVADHGNNTVKEILPNGTINTIGSGFRSPYGVAVDAVGDVFVADSGNSAVKEILPNGTIKTIGSGFSSPAGVAVDAAGDVFVADTDTSAVSEVRPNGTINTIGFGFSHPGSVAVDAAGDAFVADYGNNAVKEVFPNGTIKTIGSGFLGPSSVAVDAAADVFVANSGHSAVKEVLPNGTIDTLGSGFYLPEGVAVDGPGDLFVAQLDNSGVVELSIPTVAGAPSPVSGKTATAVSGTLLGLTPGTTYYYRAVAANAVGTAVDAQQPPESFTTPIPPTVVTGPAESISDTSATLTASVNPEGATASATFQYSTDPTFPPTVARNIGSGFSFPEGVAVDATGDVFVADQSTSAIQEVRPNGTMNSIGSGLNVPTGVAVDAAGDVFVSEPLKNAIMEVVPDGSMKIIGSGFNGPASVAVDAAGDVFVADTGNNAVKEVLPNGTMKTIGSGFDQPWGVAVDAAGDVFVGDSGNQAVKEILPDGTIQTLATGFDDPDGVAVDASGNVFVADYGTDFVKEILPGGTVRDLDSGPQTPIGVSVDAAGNVFVTELDYSQVVELSPVTTAATLAPLTGTTSTAVSATLVGLTPGTTYYYRAVATSAGGTVADTQEPPQSFTTTLADDIDVITNPASSVSMTGATLHGSVNPKGSTATVVFQYSTSSTFRPTVESPIGSGFNGPEGVAVDKAGDIFVADNGNNAVKEILPNGTINTIGTGFFAPVGVALDKAGDVFVADYGHNEVKEVFPNGTINTIGTGFSQPEGVAVDTAGDVFVADASHDAVKEVLPNGVINTIGTGFSLPAGVALDSAGDVFVADETDNAVKEVFTNGTIKTLGFGFSLPAGVAVDAAGDVFVADFGNNAVKEILRNGTIDTLGSEFFSPTGVAVDAAGDVFVADYGNNRVVELSSPTVAATPSAVSGSTATAVSATLAGLPPGATYYYRVVATSAGGTVVDTASPPQSFTTNPLTGVTTAAAIGGVEGVTPAMLTGAVFGDVDTGVPATDFTVSAVHWGDGSTNATGLSVSGSGGNFSVSGSHTYAEEGAYSLTIVVSDGDGQTATITGAADVVDAKLTAKAVAITPTEGATFSGRVATFTDADPKGMVGDYSATIVWGDGARSVGKITIVDGGGFAVTGTHVYAEEATLAVKVTIADIGGSKATALSTAKVADAPLTAKALTITLTEGATFSGKVATFTDADPKGMIGDYSATIVWGDGATSDGKITIVDGGGFAVTGTHIYTEAATHAVKVTIADSGGSKATALSTAKVADALLTARASTITPTEGATFSGKVATFTDANPKGAIADFRATIVWGDSATTSGKVTIVNTGGFAVTGSHVYAKSGTDSIKVTIADVGGSKATAVSTAKVADAPLTAKALTITPTEGATFTGTVATFTDADPKGAVADYTATIVWGDGVTSAGKITTVASGGFAVAGLHVYAKSGTDSVKVTIADVGGSKATATATWTIKAPAPVVADTAAPVPNVQPSLALNYIIALNGVFPSRDSSGPGAGSEQLLGEVRLFAGNFAPDGWAFTDGQLLKISQNTALFALLGTTYGGDGVATFALPDLRGRAAVGTGQGTGLSERTLGEGFGSESVTLNADNLPSASTQPIANSQPSLGLNYIIPMEGVFDLFNEVRLFAGNFAPGGWLFADGQLLSISSYPVLYDVLGTTYGGDGVTTFALPDLRGRVAMGVGQGPGLTDRTLGEQLGAQSVTLTTAQLPPQEMSGGGQPFDNMQPALAVNYIIALSGVYPSQDVANTTAEPILGEVRPFTGGIAPQGWSFANGVLLQISNNQALFSLLGTTYGGNGITTFALPDLRGRVPIGTGQGVGLSLRTLGEQDGLEAVTLTEAELPALTITATEGSTFSGTVAAFTDPDSSRTAADFVATVVWGDGSTTAGSITTGTGGGFAVTGSHVYTSADTETVVVTIADVGGSSATVTSTAKVSAPTSPMVHSVAAKDAFFARLGS